MHRLAASLVVAARAGGIRPGRARAAVEAAVDAYRARIRRYAGMPELDIWYDGTHVDSLLGYFEPADRGRGVGAHRRQARPSGPTGGPTPS